MRAWSERASTLSPGSRIGDEPPERRAIASNGAYSG